MFNGHHYHTLHKCVFSPDYPGYRPEVVESPHGDGKRDSAKRYAHVALKYRHPLPAVQRLLDGFLMQAHRRALEVAEELHVPAQFMPRLEYGALRVLEYPPGASSHEHTDFDLFTLNLYRNQPDKLVPGGTEVHLGELGQVVGLGPATPHYVLPSGTVQHSIVYFAIPDHAAPLTYWGDTVRGKSPAELTTLPWTVGEWLQERLARSRYAA